MSKKGSQISRRFFLLTSAVLLGDYFPSKYMRVNTY
jgi:hypothetical protein